MKRLRFHELLLLAESEHTARAVPFTSPVTVIKGENDRGKSCLIKSLYTALGAIPKIVHPKWESLNVILHLHFSVDNIRYSILKSGRRYSLFSASNDLLGTYGSVTKGLSPRLAELFDFHLQLTNASTKQPEQATPALLFLPFYFDQDSSWVENWNGFARLKQFTHYRKAIAEFHTGLKPNAYYQAKARKAVAEDNRDTLRHDRNVVKRVLDKIEQLLKNAHFDIDITSYQLEIDLLLEKCNELRKDEDRIKDEMVRLDNRRRSIERQIHITHEAANELEKDFTYAADTLDDEVECPICGAHYENSFAERFKIAADEDQLRVALTEMDQELETCMSDIEQRKTVASDVQSRIAEITELLEVRQGEVKLNDVLKSEGKKEVRVVLRDELDDLNRDIGKADGEIEDAAEDMKQFTSKKHVQEIKEYYRDRMSVYLEKLDVTELDEESCKEVDCTIKESGSDKPRALLAFYFAILKTIEKYSTTTFCPIVIDSARQQEQDSDNWRKMLEFMRDTRPSDSQMIVGLVDDFDVSLGGDVLELVDERQLLQADQYEAVAKRLRPFIDASLAD
jgi:predicted  nucleic acid-binding Zn-ribbon protein